MSSFTLRWLELQEERIPVSLLCHVEVEDGCGGFACTVACSHGMLLLDLLRRVKFTERYCFIGGKVLTTCCSVVGFELSFLTTSVV